MVDKARASACDEVTLDLEDSISVEDKAGARDAAIDALRELEWRATRGVRINSLDTEFWYDDLERVVTNVPTLDVLVVPKVRTAEDVRMVDRLLEALERRTERQQPVALEVLIEDVEGLVNVHEIAGASPRLEALIFGHGDMGLSQGANLERLAALGVRSLDTWAYARSRILVAARAAGIAAIDTPYADFKDVAGYEHESQVSCALGYDGKWAIHPDQVTVANREFSPTAAEVDRALKLVERATALSASGAAAFTFEGKMVDVVQLREAQRLLVQVDRINALASDSPEQDDSGFADGP
jgi:citrate lyase subunit beta / citryl-CoA lyase